MNLFSEDVIIKSSFGITSTGMNIVAPKLQEYGNLQVPEAETFGEGLMMIVNDLIPLLRPDLYEAAKVSIAIVAASMLISIFHSFSDGMKSAANIAGAATIASSLLLSANSLIRLAAQTIESISEYGKLLLPVMTAALAAQGGVGKSAALYAGTTVFGNILSSLLSSVLLPVVYMFLALAGASCATGEDMLSKFRDLLKKLASWILKMILTVFTAYMGITGVISGTTDAAALKVTKATISSFVPVVGGIMSDASEAVLLSAAMAKNAAGIYGIFAVLVLFLEPFLKIGCHYMVLKLTAATCSVFGVKSITDLVSDFSSAMGLLLAMTAAACILQLISTVSFLKGVA